MSAFCPRSNFVSSFRSASSFRSVSLFGTVNLSHRRANMVRGLLLLLCLAAYNLSHAEKNDATSINAWLDAQFDVYLDFHPIAKSTLGIKEDNDKLDDVSEAAVMRELEWRRASVAEMQDRFDRDTLSAEDQTSYDLWVYQLERSEAQARFLRHAYVFGRRGPHTSLPRSLINSHNVDDASDLAAYVARLRASGRYLDQYLTRAKLAAADNIRAPYFDYDLAIGHVQKILAGKPFKPQAETDFALWGDFRSKTAHLESTSVITESDAENYLGKARAALVEDVEPAYQRILNWLQTDRANTTSVAQGANKLPNGKDYYDYTLERNTTTLLSAQEVHTLGLSEVARIKEEMEAIREQVEFDGTLSEFFQHIRTADQFFHENTDEGREAYLTRARNYLVNMEEKLPEFFGILPKTALEVRRVEAYREQPGGAAHYLRGTPDGSRPGIFYAHLVDMRAVPAYGLETLAYHEGLPGHHLQRAIQLENTSLPRFRTYHSYTAYSEGWALYAEALSKEMGLFEDPYDDFGRLSGEIWRAVRLVVDTGIHAMNWSEAQAITYALDNSPRPPKAVEAEIRRYFNNPAQATAYKIGMLKIIALRNRAQKQLNGAFDYREFHDLILSSGPLPMRILEVKVDAWLRDHQAKLPKEIGQH